MPYVLRPPIRKLGFLFTVVAASLGLVAFPVIASADCPDKPTSKVFAPYGDVEEYRLVPGGDFDYGASGWHLEDSRAEGYYSLKLIDAPHLLNISSTKSLKIDKQGYAASPSVCVDVRHPSFRFFAYKRGGGVGDLGIGLYYVTSEGQRGQFASVGSLNVASYDSWGLSHVVPLAKALPLEGEETAQVRLLFFYGFNADGSSDSSASGQWRIDEVYVDPYRR